ncbi:MAG: pyrroline-5-carboxylate reductase family protein [Veillonella sp.]
MFVILDALADGRSHWIASSVGNKAAAQTMYGAGKMALESGNHPAVLRDQVTSPGGTTIAGIGAMEKGGLRSALQDGVVACLARSNELGK